MSDNELTVLTLEEAKELVADLQYAIKEAEEHRMTMLATVFNHRAGFAGHLVSIRVNPNLKRTLPSII